jgi:hypothetical protein
MGYNGCISLQCSGINTQPKWYHYYLLIYKNQTRMNIKQLKMQEGSSLNRSQQKAVRGGLGIGVTSICSVKCKSEWKEKDCGAGIACTTSGETITCAGGSATNMCVK